MGCTISRDSSKEVPDDVYCKSSEKPPSPPHTNGLAGMGDQYFSQHQKRLLRETWKIISDDQQNHGIQLFLRIFHRKPETKKLFPFGHLADDELLQNPIFRSHAKRFMHAVDTTIQNLDALEVALIPVLLRLGEKHVIIAGFKEEYLDLFMGSILDVFSEVLGKRCTNEVRDAWGHLANFIADQMQAGYQSACSKDGGPKPNDVGDVHNANKEVLSGVKDVPKAQTDITAPDDVHISRDTVGCVKDAADVPKADKDTVQDVHKVQQDDPKVTTEVLNIATDDDNARNDVHNGDSNVHNGGSNVHNATDDVHNAIDNVLNGTSDVHNATDGVPNGTDDVPNGGTDVHNAASDDRNANNTVNGTTTVTDNVIDNVTTDVTTNVTDNVTDNVNVERQISQLSNGHHTSHASATLDCTTQATKCNSADATVVSAATVEINVT